MKPEIKINTASDLSSEHRKELEEWFQEEFSYIGYQWSPPSWYVTAWIDHNLVGRAGIIERDVLVGQRSIHVGGISGVITHENWRRCGIASSVVDKAVTFIKDELDAQFCFLLSREKVASLYIGRGWKLVEGPTTFEQPSGPTTYPQLTMVLPCGEEEWPEGLINLCGLPW